MDPQQELFTAILIALRDLGISVYDGAIPPEGTGYPFVYLADTQQDDVNYKGAVGGYVFQTIHVWHNNPRKRGTVSALLLDVKRALRSIGSTSNFSWLISNLSQTINNDDTTQTPLVHGIISVEYQFT